MTAGTATKLAISGMKSAAEAGQVETVLSTLPGVYAVRIDLATRVAIVRHESSVGLAQLIRAVEEAGCRARRAVPGEGSAEYASSPWGALRAEGQTPETEMSRWRALTVLGGAIILLHLAADLWLKGRRDHWAFAHFILGTVGQAIIGWRFYAEAWRGLMRGRIGPGFLVAAATTLGYALSARRTFSEYPELLFTSVSIILTVAASGRWLELWLRLRAGQTLRDLVELAPLSARVMRDGKEEDVLACDLLAGDLAVVRPGERFPADGTVVEGRSAADESMLTGEALPMPKHPASQVLGGTVNGHGRVVLRVDRVAADTALARMVRMVNAAGRTRPHLARRAERLAALIGPGAVLVASAALVGCYVGSGPAAREQGLMRAFAVLAVACPWALLLAVPTALNASLGRAARLGILPRSGPVLEACARLKAVTFDLTGTLTLGRPELAQVRVAAGTDQAEALKVAGALAGDFGHPLDVAICEAVRAQELEVREADHVRRVPGRGIRGEFAGEVVLLGSRKFMDEEGVYLGALEDPDEEQEAGGRKGLLLARGGKAQALFVFEDPLKPGARHTVDRIQKMGLIAHVLSGETRSLAAAVGAAAGIPAEMVRAEVKPEDRPMQIRAIRELRGPVAMVGNGVADGPALGEADVGMAIGSGAEVDVESADVVLVGQDLRGVLRALRMARRGVRAMHVNLTWALAFNVVALPLAALGLLPAVSGALAMVLAALVVAANSCQLSLRPGSFLGLSAGG
jgi:Cu+-exporting ATPase